MPRVKLEIPPFLDGHPEIWFTNIEAQFIRANIDSDELKFIAVVEKLDDNKRVQVADAISNPPKFNKYKNIKEEILKYYSEILE